MFSIHVCIKLCFQYMCVLNDLQVFSAYFNPQPGLCLFNHSELLYVQKIFSALLVTNIKFDQNNEDNATAFNWNPFSTFSLSLKLHCIQIYASATPRAIFTQIFSSPAFPSFPKLFLFSLSLVWQGKSHEGGRRSADCAKGPDIGFVSDKKICIKNVSICTAPSSRLLGKFAHKDVSICIHIFDGILVLQAGACRIPRCKILSVRSCSVFVRGGGGGGGEVKLWI